MASEVVSLPSADELRRGRLALNVSGPVATVTLNAPHLRNAQIPSMWHALEAIGAGLPEDVRIVVVRGAGSGFSAGLDLGLLSPAGVAGEKSTWDLLRSPAVEISEAIDGYQRGFTWLREPRYTTIAEVHGYAIGAGFQLALACDIRVAADDAWFCMKEPALGLVPDLTGTRPLVDLVGYSRAFEICASARKVPCDEALRLGLVTSAVRAEELEQHVADLIDSILVNDASAVRETKGLLQATHRSSLEVQRRLEREAQIRRFAALFPDEDQSVEVEAPDG